MKNVSWVVEPGKITVCLFEIVLFIFSCLHFNYLCISKMKSLHWKSEISLNFICFLLNTKYSQHLEFFLQR